MLAVVAPGQGALRSATVRAWAEVASVGHRLEAAGAQTGLDLTNPSRDTRSNDTLPHDTRLAQCSLLTLGVAAWAELVRPHHDHHPCDPHHGLPLVDTREVLLAGHSVGELTVAAVGGALDPAAALRVTAERARSMALSAGRSPTGMTALTAVRGGAAVLADLMTRINDAGLVVANRNGAGQIVVAGPQAALDRWQADLDADPVPGLRCTRLAVAGAFHTDAMAPAESVVRDAVARERRDSRGDLAATPRYVSGLDGLVVDGRALLDRLPRQVVRPVRWDLVVATLVEQGVTGVLELPPAGTLTALVRRDHPQLATFALRTPDDLAAARTFCRAHLGDDRSGPAGMLGLSRPADIPEAR